MMNLKKTAQLFIVLKKADAPKILYDLLDSHKTFSFFCEKYGVKIKWALYELVRLGIIKKIFDEGKVAIGYKITMRGRWIAHACIKFEKELESYQIKDN